MTVLESVHGLSSLPRLHHWSAPSNYRVLERCYWSPMLSSLCKLTHIQHTLHWCLDSACLLAPLRCRQPIHPSVTTHVIPAREMEMEGLSQHPADAVTENPRLHRPRASVMHNITFQNSGNLRRLSSPNDTHTSSAQGFNSPLFGSYFWLKTSTCLKWNLPAANKSGKLLLYVNKVSLVRCLIALWSCTLVNSDRLKVVYFWLPAVA